MKEEVKTTSPTELAIQREVQKFAVNPEELKRLAADYSIITIESGMKIISAARKDLKKRRADITNKGKELRNNFTIVSKGIISHENELIEIISPEEERLEKLEAEIEAAAELKRQEVLRAEQEMIAARVKELETLGAAFNGVQYSLNETTITYAEVKLFTEREFERALTFFKEEYDRDQAVKIWKAEQAALKYDSFMKVLFEDGWDWDEGDLISKADFVLNPDILASWDDVQLKAFMDSTNAKIAVAEEKRLEDEKIKADQKAESDRLAAIQKEQDAIRLKQQEEQRIIDQKKAEINEQLKTIEDQKAAAKKSEEERIKAEQDKKYAEIAEEKRKKEEILTLEDEAKRKAELAPDIDKLLLTIDKIKNCTKDFPELSTQKGKDIMVNVNSYHNKIIAYIEEQVKTL